MTTSGEDRRFGLDFLDPILEWIVENLNTADRVTEAELEYWADHSDDYVHVDDLDKWAEDNGWILPDAEETRTP